MAKWIYFVRCVYIYITTDLAHTLTLTQTPILALSYQPKKFHEQAKKVISSTKKKRIKKKEIYTFLQKLFGSLRFILRY